MFRFQVEAVVGEGAFATVYRAKLRSTGKLFAMKEFRERCDTWTSACAKSEIKALLDLRGQAHILKVLEVGRESDGRVFFISGLEQGTLYDLLQKQRFLNEKATGSVLRQMMTGLAAMHDMQYIHRDVKPENVLLTIKDPSDLSTAHVTLADLGSAIKFDEVLSGDYVTTRYYRSPEMVLKWPTYGPEVDVWAVGCICFELLSGKPLFPAQAESDLLLRMSAVLGSPPLHDERFTKYNKDDHHASSSSSLVLPSGFSKQPILRWFANSSLENPSREASALLGKMLTWLPSERIQCATALRTEPFLQQA